MRTYFGHYIPDHPDDEPLPAKATFGEAAIELLKLHPTPWIIGQMNAEGVVVKDSCGHSVFEEWFGDVPDEISGNVVAKYISDRHALARFLVEWSSRLP